MIRDLAAFVAAKAVILEAALHPYFEQSLSRPYLELLLKVASKKLLVALGAGYYGADLLATIWCHTRQPDQLEVTGEQRHGVWPPVVLTVKVRPKNSPTPVPPPGRLHAVGAKLDQVPPDVKSLELRFRYPGDPGEDKETVDLGVTRVASREHVFVKASEAVVSAHLPGGKLVAEETVKIAAQKTELGSAGASCRGQCYDVCSHGHDPSGRPRLAPNPMTGTKLPGEVCTHSRECKRTCCTCPGGEWSFNAAACLDGRCADAAEVCAWKLRAGPISFCKWRRYAR